MNEFSTTRLNPDLLRIMGAVLVLAAVVAVADNFNRRAAWLMAGVLLLGFLVGQGSNVAAQGNWQQFFDIIGGRAMPPAGRPQNTPGGGGQSGLTPGGGMAGGGGGGGGGGSF
jgi:uncharacterized membrane protein YgcG